MYISHYPRLWSQRHEWIGVSMLTLNFWEEMLDKGYRILDPPWISAISGTFKQHGHVSSGRDGDSAYWGAIFWDLPVTQVLFLPWTYSRLFNPNSVHPLKKVYGINQLHIPFSIYELSYVILWISMAQSPNYILNPLREKKY